MMDPATLTALITAIGSMLIALSTHIKKSKCCGVEIETRRLQASVPTTPLPDEKTKIITN